MKSKILISNKVYNKDQIKWVKCPFPKETLKNSKMSQKLKKRNKRYSLICKRANKFRFLQMSKKKKLLNKKNKLIKIEYFNYDTKFYKFIYNE